MTEREKIAFESGYYAGYMAANNDLKREFSLASDMLKTANEQLIKLVREAAKANGTSEEVEKQLELIHKKHTKKSETT